MSLSGRTFTINENPSITYALCRIAVNFTDGTSSYSCFECDTVAIYYHPALSGTAGPPIVVYENSEWQNASYRTITFTSEATEFVLGDDISNQAQFEAWLAENATEEGAEPEPVSNPVSVSKLLLGPKVMGGSSSSAAGAPGLAPAPAAGDHAKFLRGDGTWNNELPAVTSSDNGKALVVIEGNWGAGNVDWNNIANKPSTYTPPLAADGTRGGVQVGYTQSGKNYPVQLDGEKMYVNVPWTDHYAWADITGKPDTATRWPAWNEVTGKPNRAGSATDGGDAYNSDKVDGYHASSFTLAALYPNDTTDSKTKYRCCQSINVGTTVHYYKIGQLQATNNGNKGHMIIRGRIGGWTAANIGSIEAIITNRDAALISCILHTPYGTEETIYTFSDIALYRETNGVMTVYVKAYSYFAFDIDVEVHQGSITYDGTSVTAPTGTLQVLASTSGARRAYIGGNKPTIAGKQDYQMAYSSGPVAGNGTQATIAYPSGYTVANTMPIGCFLLTSGTRHDVTPVEVEYLDSSGIHVVNYGASSGQIAVALMKY